MTLKEKIQKDLIISLKERDELKTSVLRMLFSNFLNKEIELKKKEEGLNKEDEAQVVKSEIKKHNKAIEAYEKANRLDLAGKEKKELEILETYLPTEQDSEDS